jgi:D-serine deaminase-like pyridoxal phosphate-dependent protein
VLVGEAARLSHTEERGGLVATTPGISLDQIDTPALIVDLDVLEANIVRMADFTRLNKVSMRAHIKSHKIPELARLQVTAGAAGIVCQKLGEAELMADAGLTDILVPYPIIGPTKIRRLLDLARRVRFTTTIDSIEGATAIGAAAEAAGLVIDTMLEVDNGYHRCGVSPEEAVALATRIARDLPGLRFKGLLGYEGHVYGLDAPQDIDRVARKAYDVLGAIADELRTAGISVECVSTGSSVSFQTAAAHSAVTEIRVGGYVFGDRSVVKLGGATREQCSLTVLSTVVSKRGTDHVVVDAGAKALSLATLSGIEGYGLILGHEDAVLAHVADEHGMISVPPGGRPFALGERVMILPNEHTVVVNQFLELVGVRSGRVESAWPVAGHGLMQ